MKVLTLRKPCILMGCFIFFCVQTKAQQVSLGFEFVLPKEGYAIEDVVVAGFGLSARYEQKLTKNFSGLVSGGGILFTGKNHGNPILAIPMQAGVKYYFQNKGIGFYGMAQLGIHSFFGGADAHGTNFSYAPGIGYRFQKLDVGLQYEKIVSSWISVSYFGVRVGYAFR